MSLIHGFERTRAQKIPELKIEAEIFRHVKTGAELLSLVNDDENKVFGITFRTPPSDSTGVPHILEHSVLCGSRKYPVKEPFVELLKGSLKTFLNAMTYPDKTCYPVASQNLQDFYNLIDVYLDAVFYPRLTPAILQQEGWHFELSKQEDPLIYKGVVFNEMKGAYSSPDTLLSEYSQQSLFPDHPYGLDSGGDPKVIPSLTFEQFKAFHHKYYHPSNARIFFYGDDEPEKRLAMMNDYLKEFERIKIDSAIPLQPFFEKPRRLSRPFASGEDGDQGSKGMITLNWLLEETTDAELNLAFHMLEYILLGMPGSPLRKALIDSGYGEDLAGGGLGSELRQMSFSTGLKGIDLKNADKIEALILKTLQDLAEQGIDPRNLEAALNTIEFTLRENNTGNYPRGLLLMLRAQTTWLYGGDPLALVAFEAPLEAVKSKLSGEGAFFEGLIERFLLNNPHRTTLLLEPDPDLASKEQKSEQERLSSARSNMSPDDIAHIIQSTEDLKQMQETPDPPEALASIPCLKIADLDPKNKTLPSLILEEKGTRILYHNLLTNGIAYLDLGLDLHTLPQGVLPYARLFGRALLEMGTEKEDYVSLAQRISSKTGGIYPTLFSAFVKGSEEGSARLFLRGKAMPAQTEEMLAILKDVLLTVRLDNRERFRQMVLEAKARMEHSLVPGGHQMVNLRLRSHFSEADWAAEQMKGVSYLFFLRKLAQKVETHWPEVLACLEEIRECLINRNAMILNITLDEAGWSRFQPRFHEFLDALPASPVERRAWKTESSPDFEGMTIPSQINYVGKGANLYALGYSFHGSAHVITNHLRTAWLWERIRVQGGAYGAFCLFDRLSGVLTFVSYRDPNLTKTLEAFDGAGGFLKNTELHEDEITKGIIGTIGDIDQYRLPDAKGYISMVRHLSGETDEDRQRMREEILNTRARDIKAFAQFLDALKEEGLVKVLGSRSAIEESLSERPGWLEVLNVL